MYTKRFVLEDDGFDHTPTFKQGVDASLWLKTGAIRNMNPNRIGYVYKGLGPLCKPKKGKKNEIR